MINIAELLKDAPKDLKLYSPICGHCKLSCILYDDGIRVIAHDVPFRFDKYGRFCSADDAECLLFPSKDCRTWEGWKLPIEPKFKVGDLVVKKDGANFYGGNYVEQITLIEIDEEGKRIWLSSKTWIDEDEIRLWTTSDIKDGDVLMTTSIRNCPFIYRKTSRNNDLAYYYAGVDGDGNFCEGCLKRTLYHFGPVENVVPATKEQRDLLFAKMKEAGYQWDADKKELRKIQPHYDISNFHAGMPVLVRDGDDRWKYVIFSHTYDGIDGKTYFNACGWTWDRCIPFNDETKHLIGTTDQCDERFINW